MGRLIAFDQQTASALVAGTRIAAQLGHGSPLRAALATEHEATLVMPAREKDQLLVVSVRRMPQRSSSAATAVATAPAKKRNVWLEPGEQPFEPVAYEASGFLGLEDEPVYSEPAAPQPKKKWWQRILD